MQIFIDESGNFISSDGWSVICALSIPHKFTGQARRQIEFESRHWDRKKGELKGGQITLSQFTKLQHSPHGVCDGAELQHVYLPTSGQQRLLLLAPDALSGSTTNDCILRCSQIAAEVSSHLGYEVAIPTRQRTPSVNAIKKSGRAV